MLFILASQKECEITAKPAELREVAQTISQLGSAGHGSHSFLGDISRSPWPYDRVLKELIVRVTSGPVCATVDTDALNIVGRAEFMASLASYFDFADETPSGHHHHHDYIEGDNYVSPNSVPLVIGVGGKLGDP